MKEIFPAFQIFAVPDPGKSSLLSPPPAGARFLILASEGLDIHREMLDKLIAAVGLDPASEAHLLHLTANAEFRFASYVRHSDLRYVLLFGLEPSEVGLQLDAQPYLSLNIANFRLIFADPLDQIATNKEQKLRLWNALQAMFEV